MSDQDDVWGQPEDDEYFLACTQSKPQHKKQDDAKNNTSIEIKEEVEEDIDWGGEEDDEFVVRASQILSQFSKDFSNSLLKEGNPRYLEDPMMNMTETEITENKVKSPHTPATGGHGPSGALPVAASSSPPIMEFRSVSFMKTRQHESENLTHTTWNANISDEKEAELQKMAAENMAIKQRLFALEGENSTLRRNIDTTTNAKAQEVYERVSKQMEEKKKEADKKREAADEKEKLNSELASQKMEVLKLQWKVRHSKTRDSSNNSMMSPHQSSSIHFPTAKSVMSKGMRPPVPKFIMSPQSVNRRLMKMAGSDKQLVKEADTRDFSLRKPAVLADYDNDEYTWESNDDGAEKDSFLNLSSSSSTESQERMEETTDDDSDSSSSSDDSCADWELELAQNPISPLPPKEFIPSNVDAVIDRLKQGSSSSSHSSPVLKDVDEDETRNSVLEKLADLATSRAPWVQTFAYIKKNVDHRFESLKTLVADVTRLTPRLIADVEIGEFSSDVEIQADEGRLWNWYLRHIDKKNQESGNRLKGPSYMPGNCEAGPSMKFLEFITHLPTEPLSAWSLLSHVKAQLKDLIWTGDLKNEWRIYERNNLETFLKLLMWVSELWPYVMEEESSPEIVRSHLPHWATELRSWTAVLLETGNGDFLFNGKFHRTILTLVLESLAKIIKAGYFHATYDNYKLLSNVLKRICSHCSELTPKHLMDMCIVLKYGFKDNAFINVLCEGANENLCLADSISNGFLVSFGKERDPALKAKMFVEYVSTLNLLMHKDIRVYHSSKLSRAKLIEKKTNKQVNINSNEYDEVGDSDDPAWLHPNNWEDPDKRKGLCQCRKLLCGNVITMFNDILPLWREAIYDAEAELVALQKQHKMEDEKFLKDCEIAKRRKNLEELETKEVEKLKKTYQCQYDAYKRRNKFFNDSKLSFSCDSSDLPKVEEFMQSLDTHDNEMQEFREKKETLILRRKEYEKDIMTQGLLDNEVFSNWTQVGKLLRKRLNVNLPWWLKRYERESTIFDQALEVGMIFMHHFLHCSNLASALGDEGLRNFLIVSIILKANSEEFLVNDRMAPIIRELTTLNAPQYPDDDQSVGSESKVQSSRCKNSHKLVYENGNRILKMFPVTEEHLPDLKQSDLNRQKVLIDSEQRDFMRSNESFVFRSPANKAEKSRIMQTDDVIWMNKRLKKKNIEEIIRPSNNQLNALGYKKFSDPYRKATCVDEGSRYFNENGEDTTPQRHKRDKLKFVDNGRPYSSFGPIGIGYVSETEKKFFMVKGEEDLGSESVNSLIEDTQIDKEDLKKYL